MADNDAARANFEELKNHIELANKRIKSLQPGTEAYDQSVNELSDYYERTVQLRKMQADTAIEERNEAQKETKELKWYILFLMAIMFSIILIQFAWLAPEESFVAWTTIKPYITIDRILMTTLVIFVVSNKL